MVAAGFADGSACDTGYVRINNVCTYIDTGGGSSNCSQGQVRINNVCVNLGLDTEAATQGNVRTTGGGSDSNPDRLPDRIKLSPTLYLNKSTLNNVTNSCVGSNALNDSTCVVPYLSGPAAGLAAITASLTKTTPSIGGTGTNLKWTTVNAISVSVTCAGVATYGPADVPIQGDPSGINLNSAVAGSVTCNWTAMNSDHEIVTATATAVFAPPVPPTIAAGFTNPNPVIGQGGTMPIWNSTGAKNVYVSCINSSLPDWAGKYLQLQGNPSSTTFLLVTPLTLTCNFTATNDVGQTATASTSATFRMPPPPSVNGWWDPATISAGQSSTFHYASANVTYLGIVCTGVGYSFGDGGGSMNTSWYYFPWYFSTAGVQNCGVQGVNSAGQMAYVDVPLVINPAGTPSGSGPQSPPANAYGSWCGPSSTLWDGQDCTPPGPGNSSDGGDSGTGTE